MSILRSSGGRAKSLRVGSENIENLMTVVDRPGASCRHHQYVEESVAARSSEREPDALLFDCLLTVFDDSYTVPIVKNTQNHWCTNRHRSAKTVPTMYQRCTNRQKQSKDSQNSKNDHWCTNRHMSTKTLPTVYQSSKQ